MSFSLDILESYLHRRGYFYNDIKDMTHADTGSSSVDEIPSTLDNYFAFLRTLKPIERVSLNSLHFELYMYLNKIDSEICTKFSENITVDQRFNSHLSDSTLEQLESFASSLKNNELACIIDDFLTASKRNDNDVSNEVARFKPEEAFVESDSISLHQTTNAHNAVISCDLSANRFDLFLGLESGRILILRNGGGAQFSYEVHAHSGPVFDLKVLSCAQNYLLSASFDQSIKLWDLKLIDNNSDPKYFTYMGHTDSVYCLDCDFDSNRFVSGSADTKCCLFDFECTRPVRVLAYHSDVIQNVCFAAGLIPGHRSVVISCAADKKVCLWSADQAKPVRLYNDLAHPTTLTSYHPTAHLLIIGSEDGKLRLFDVRTDKCMQVFDLCDLTPFSLDFNRRSSAGNREFYVGGSTQDVVGVIKLKKLCFSEDHVVKLDRQLELAGGGCCQLIAAQDGHHDFVSVVAIE